MQPVNQSMKTYNEVREFSPPQQANPYASPLPTGLPKSQSNQNLFYNSAVQSPNNNLINSYREAPPSLLPYAGHKQTSMHQHHSVSALDQDHFVEREADSYKNPYIEVNSDIKNQEKLTPSKRLNHEAIGGVEQLKYFDVSNPSLANHYIETK